MIKVFTTNSLWPDDDLACYIEMLEESGYEVTKIVKIKSSFFAMFGEDVWHIYCHRKSAE